MILRFAIGLLWVALCAQQRVSAAAGAGWTDMKMLMGDWTGEGSGKPGTGTGEFSFVPELQGKILVRHSFADYPGARHDDLMIVYRQDDATRADYYDSEGHVIHYAVQSDHQRIVFMSDNASQWFKSQRSPCYRLTYTSLPDEKLRVQFEIDNKTYLDGICRRKR